jgi:hypothetical protein
VRVFVRFVILNSKNPVRNILGNAKFSINIEKLKRKIKEDIKKFGLSYV